VKCGVCILGRRGYPPFENHEGWGIQSLFDIQFGEFFDGPCEDGLVTANHDGSLDEFGMVGHDTGQLIIA